MSPSIIGIYVTSDKPISVHVAPFSAIGYGVSTPDTVIVRPIIDTSSVYFLAGYGKMDSVMQPM